MLICCSVASVCHCVGVLSRVVLWCCVVVVLCCCSGVLHCPDVVLVVVMLFMSVFDLYVCYEFVVVCCCLRACDVGVLCFFLLLCCFPKCQCALLSHVLCDSSCVFSVCVCFACAC